jgi:arylformamidase
VETHQALLKADIRIIEGLNLKRVQPGRVRLVCLPFKIAGADGAPARALVRPMERLGRE